MHIIGQFSASDSADNWGGPQGTLEFITDQVEELIVSLIEEIRERPMVAAAIFAGIFGVIVGALIARATRPKPRAAVPKIAAGDLVAVLSGLVGEARPRAKEVSKAVRSSGRAASKTSEHWLGRLGVSNTTDLIGIGGQLMENPMVRSFIRAMVVSQLRKRIR